MEGRWICNRIEKPIGRTMHRYFVCLTVAGIPSSLTLLQQSGELRTTDVRFFRVLACTFRDRLHNQSWLREETLCRRNRGLAIRRYSGR